MTSSARRAHGGGDAGKRRKKGGTAQRQLETQRHSGKKTRGLGKWDGLGRGAKLLGDFASYLISPEILPYSTALPLTPPSVLSTLFLLRLFFLSDVPPQSASQTSLTFIAQRVLF